jgi:hypothetical protein
MTGAFCAVAVGVTTLALHYGDGTHGQFAMALEPLKQLTPLIVQLSE